MSIVRIASLAGLAVSATALAGPTTPEQANRPTQAKGVISPSPEGLSPFCEDFNSCALGNLVPCNGWEFWYSTAVPDGQIVAAAPPSPGSGGNALRYVAGMNDNVHFLNHTDGVFYVSALTFVPAAAAGDGYIILNNDYNNVGPPTVWASQVKFGATANTVSNDAGGFAAAPTLPLQRDTWVLWEGMIDIRAGFDRFHDVYGGQQLTLSENITPGVMMKWTDNALNLAGSPAEIESVDLYSAGIDGMLVDDFVATCFADLDQSTGCGVVDIFDFLKFSNYFDANNPIACNADTSTGLSTCDIFDFLFFSNLFDAGCD
jgi:hypothetical protein